MELRFKRQPLNRLPRTIDLPDFPGFQPDAITTEATILHPKRTFPDHFGTAGNFHHGRNPETGGESLADHFHTPACPASVLTEDCHVERLRRTFFLLLVGLPQHRPPEPHGNYCRRAPEKSLFPPRPRTHKFS